MVHLYMEWLHKSGKFPVVLFGFTKYVNMLKITVLFRHYKQTTDRNCMFCTWSDKIKKGYWFNTNTGEKVAVIRRECEMYTTVFWKYSMLRFLNKFWIFRCVW